VASRAPSFIPKIVVAGDVCIDWLEYSVRPVEPAEEDHGVPNWQLQPGIRMIAKDGGALLLARLIEAATKHDVIAQGLDEIEVIPPEKVMHSMVKLERVRRSWAVADEKNLVYRVREHDGLGFSGPTRGATHIPIHDDDPQAHIVVLDDAADGFREMDDAWPAALRDGQPIVVLKMFRPLAKGNLWEALRTKHADRLVVIVSADDLRAEGVNISRQLSWERTATDFVWQLANLDHPLANCVNLVVRFGIDGAIHSFGGPGLGTSRLYFDPAAAENDFRGECPGEMVGQASAFAAALTARIVRMLPRQDGETLRRAVGDGVRDGIRSSRRLFLQGFGNAKGEPEYPGAELFRRAWASDPTIADVEVPPVEVTQTARPDPHFWSILKDLRGRRLEQVAYDIVERGEDVAVKNVPLARFGELRTADRVEIESFRSIKNLIKEYVDTPKPRRPLSIAVFGPPGAGKSFGVTEVAKSVDKDITPIEFNLAQFTSTEDLSSAFHRVRDEVLRGKIPLVFFDEFDSGFDGRLGWLKYFLVPMQDGKFKDGDWTHPIGKAIFVFAGGTSRTYAHFARAGRWLTDAKAPDFASRLRGYVDILGPNPVRNEEEDEDPFAIVRRAVLFRSQLRRKVRHIFDGKDCARVDRGVLRAFLKVPEYKHGARSMEAIIDMSMLSRRKSYEQAALPPTEQLKLHVDADLFSQLLLRDVLFGAARERVAKAIHEKYRRDQQGKKPPDDPAMRPWEKLSEPLRDSNRQQADHIPEKLERIGYGYAPATGGKPKQIEFSRNQVEVLAELEHERWMEERLRDGWKLGPRDVDSKVSPDLVPWSQLSPKSRKTDRDTVRGIAEFMAEAGFEIYPLE
jgi:RyR domain/ATPase family associated with various cellular activities (AAA)